VKVRTSQTWIVLYTTLDCLGFKLKKYSFLRLPALLLLIYGTFVKLFSQLNFIVQKPGCLFESLRVQLLDF